MLEWQHCRIIQRHHSSEITLNIPVEFHRNVYFEFFILNKLMGWHCFATYSKTIRNYTEYIRYKE